MSSKLLIVDGVWLLERCPYCGKEHVRPSSAESMCYDCQVKLKRYHALKHKLKAHPSNETSEQLAAMIAEYKVAKEHGLRVPRDIM